jgi:hypothetical protein
MSDLEGEITVAEWRELVKAGHRAGTYVGLFRNVSLRVRVKRVWPTRLDVIFLDAHPADEFGPATPAGFAESVHPSDVIPA